MNNPDQDTLIRALEDARRIRIGRQVWKWSASVAEVVISGQAATKSEAVAEAERAIDRALASKKLRLVPPEDRARHVSPAFLFRGGVYVGLGQ
jgi:hypothetical protein